jgi:hypothetical protein
MDSPLRPIRMPTADLYLADGTHLELGTDWHAGLGWWRIEESGRRRLTVAQAFEQAPRALRHEVLLEAQQLASVTMEEHRRAGGGDPECHVAVEVLAGEIRAAMVVLREDPSMRS